MPATPHGYQGHPRQSLKRLREDEEEKIEEEEPAEQEEADAVSNHHAIRFTLINDNRVLLSLIV